MHVYRFIIWLHIPFAALGKTLEEASTTAWPPPSTSQSLRWRDRFVKLVAVVGPHVQMNNNHETHGCFMDFPWFLQLPHILKQVDINIDHHYIWTYWHTCCNSKKRTLLTQSQHIYSCVVFISTNSGPETPQRPLQPRRSPLDLPHFARRYPTKAWNWSNHLDQLDGL